MAADVHTAIFEPASRSGMACAAGYARAHVASSRFARYCRMGAGKRWMSPYQGDRYFEYGVLDRA